MRERPPGIADSEVLTTVRLQWDPVIDEVAHLPVGFGAHHWAASSEGAPPLFVTLDRLLPHRSGDELERVYAAAARLAAEGLDFVLASLPAVSGTYTVPLTDGALSVSRWQQGRSGNGEFRSLTEQRECAGMLARLHGTPAPPGIPDWRPVVFPTSPTPSRPACGREGQPDRTADARTGRSSTSSPASRAGPRPTVLCP